MLRYDSYVKEDLILVHVLNALSGVDILRIWFRRDESLHDKLVRHNPPLFRPKLRTELFHGDEHIDETILEKWKVSGYSFACGEYGHDADSNGFPTIHLSAVQSLILTDDACRHFVDDQLL